MMTMIAGLSGLLAAVVILTVLIFLVACKKSKKYKIHFKKYSIIIKNIKSFFFCSQHECDKCSEAGSSTATTTDAGETQSKCSSTAPFYNFKNLEARSISVICDQDGSKGNLHSNLNKAFESSELNLHTNLARPKQKKKTHWQDEMEMQRETAIQIERY